MTIDNATIGTLTAVVTLLGGLYTVSRRISISYRLKRERYREDILSQAKKEAEKFKDQLEVQIKALESEFEVQKDSVSKDLAHMRETYSMEIKSLGDKIEDMRDQINQQHGQLVALLTRMIDK